jgi:NAD+ kinase
VKSIALIANSQRESAVTCARQIAGLLRDCGVRTLCTADLARILGCAAAADEAALAETDMLVALGGDGTILSAARSAAPRGTPVLSIHAGGPASFGFLAEATPGCACEAVQAVLDGR